MPEALLTLLLNVPFAAVAAAGFGVLFSVPRRHLPGCALCGATGYVLREVVRALGGSIELGTLLGASAIGLLAFVLARAHRAPELIFSVTGAIPLVPGAFAYRAMLGFIDAANADPAVIDAIMLEALAFALKTGLLLAAIAVGILLPTLLLRRPRPVV